MKFNKLKSTNNYILLPLILFNLFDGLATYIGLNLGIYIELNKMLDFIYQLNSLVFILIKIILPTLILVILSIKLKENVSKITRIFIILGNSIYSILCVYHIFLLSSLII